LGHWRLPPRPAHLPSTNCAAAWSAASPGGTALQGGAYRLSGIAGQPVIGESSADGSYSVDAGYSELSVPPLNSDASQVFLPFILR